MSNLDIFRLVSAATRKRNDVIERGQYTIYCLTANLAKAIISCVDSCKVYCGDVGFRFQRAVASDGFSCFVSVSCSPFCHTNLGHFRTSSMINTPTFSFLFSVCGAPCRQASTFLLAMTFRICLQCCFAFFRVGCAIFCRLLPKQLAILCSPGARQGALAISAPWLKPISSAFIDRECTGGFLRFA